MANQNSRQGTHYSTPEVLGFVEKTHSLHDAALKRAFEAPSQHGMPAIQIAPSEGKTLTMLMKLMHAQNVVEVGTLAGFSALCIARGLPPAGKVISFELDARHAGIARDNIAFANESARIEVRVGAALDGLRGITDLGPFDAMFIDADKGGYPDYARWALQNLRPGGLLIADNSYYFGSLLAAAPEAARMRDFHAFVAENFDSACIPTPDGMVIALKRST